MKKDILKVFNNKDKRFYCNIVKVSASGMTRKMRFYIIKQNKLVDITDFIAETSNLKLDKDYNLIIRGCGMDMVFNTLYNLYLDFKINEPYQSKNFNYKLI